MAKRKRPIKSSSTSPSSTATSCVTATKPAEPPSHNTTKTQILVCDNSNNQQKKKRTKNEINIAIEEAFNQINKQIECPICLGVLEDTQIVPSCQHRFCRDCISSSLRKCKNECPSCRVPIATRRILRDDFEFGSLVRNIYVHVVF